MIGLSLALCIKDVIEGRFQEEELEFVISGTACPDDEAFARKLAEYRQSHWYRNARRGETIAWRLWRRDLIAQPKLDRQPVHGISGGHWIDQPLVEHGGVKMFWCEWLNGYVFASSFTVSRDMADNIGVEPGKFHTWDIVPRGMEPRD